MRQPARKCSLFERFLGLFTDTPAPLQGALRARHLLLIVALLVARPVGAGEADPGIFVDDSVFEIEMHFPFAELCMNPRDEVCEDVPGWVIYLDRSGNQVRVDIRIRTRGRWNPKTANCEFPSLFIFFDAEQTEGTVFEGQTMLPLTTHCRHHYRNYQDYVQIEYLAHQIYGLLTDISLRTRLMQVHYKDAESRLNRKRYAFFVEHFEQMAARTGTRYIEVDNLDLDTVRPEEMARFSVFQFMIGNLDWSALKSHNVALFRDGEGTVSPVPFDFDYSGIVYTPYAKPPREVPVYSILTRHYRGLCWPGLDWDAVLGQFHDIRPQVFEGLEKLPKVSGKQRSRVNYFLLRFYEILESDKDCKKKITSACREIPEDMFRQAPD